MVWALRSNVRTLGWLQFDSLEETCKRVLWGCCEYVVGECTAPPWPRLALSEQYFVETWGKGKGPQTVLSVVSICRPFSHIFNYISENGPLNTRNFLSNSYLLVQPSCKSFWGLDYLYDRNNNVRSTPFVFFWGLFPLAMVAAQKASSYLEVPLTLSQQPQGWSCWEEHSSVLAVTVVTPSCPVLAVKYWDQDLAYFHNEVEGASASWHFSVHLCDVQRYSEQFN